MMRVDFYSRRYRDKNNKVITILFFPLFSLCGILFEKKNENCFCLLSKQIYNNIIIEYILQCIIFNIIIRRSTVRIDRIIINSSLFNAR